MKPTIHTVHVPIQDQSQADRLKAVCIDYGLPIPLMYDGFEFVAEYKYFTYAENGKKFSIYSWDNDKTQVTEP